MDLFHVDDIETEKGSIRTDHIGTVLASTVSTADTTLNRTFRSSAPKS
jgi:hypothetical protein